jgi:phosphatidate cytidylyltransferase
VIPAHLSAPVLWTLGGVLAALCAGTAAAFALARRRPGRDHAELRLRVRSWWVMVGVFAGALFLSPTAAVVLLAFVSYLALKEYLSLVPSRRADRRVMFLAYAAVPLQYYWAATGWYGMFIIFIPVYMFLLMPLRMVTIGETRDFLRAAGTLHWGLMVAVFSLSHAAFLLALPPSGNPGAGGAGLLLFLLVLTEANDVAQYAWGRTLGRRKVVPAVSPGKTWEGLAGGVATTALLGALLGPWLTPFGAPEAAALGLLLGAAGFAGDVTVSAVKRDLGVKDTGTLLPGHGGILDRVDSLIFTAPLFFHLVWYRFY